MNQPTLIGTGFWACAFEHEAKQEFFSRYWRKCIGKREVVIIDNSELGLRTQTEPYHVIRIDHNLGHIGDGLGQNEPHLRGWSMSWIIPAMIAYSRHRDFIYVEQDALVFGAWHEALAAECESHGWLAAFGAEWQGMGCEQSLFWIKAEAISRFVAAYMAITDGDSVTLPERKFAMMQRADSRIGVHGLKVGRERPITPYAHAWYFQQATALELMMLQQKGIL